MLLTLFSDPSGFLRPNNRGGENNYLTDLHNYNKAIEMEVKNKFHAAVKIYDNLLNKFKDSPQLFYHRGVNKLRMQDFSTALSDFNNAILLNPFYSEAYNERATCNRHLGFYLEALSDNNKAVELNIGHFNFYFNRALTKERLLNLEGAYDDYNMSAYFNPYHASSYINKGQIQYKLGNKERAELDLKKGAALDPKDLLAQKILGILLLEKKEYSKAKKYLIRVKELGAPDDQQEVLMLIRICEDNQIGKIIRSEEKFIDRYTRLNFPY